MGHNIPPFAAIRAFVALFRRGSLRMAGEELGVSASAVSHQLNALEEHLGKKLLYKKENRLHLTETGECLARELGEGLDQLERATLKATGRNTDRKNHLTIGMFQSLAELWFVPVLAIYHAQNPETTISIVTGAEFLNGSFEGVDLAICYGQHIPQGYEGTVLMEETLLPLASAEYLSGFSPISNPSEVVHHVLIHCSAAADEWQTWAHQNNVSLSGTQRWLEVDTRSAAYQAAEQGLGLAMGRRPMCDLALSKQRLQRLFGHSSASGLSYFLIYPKHKKLRDHVSGFALWLREFLKTDDPDATRLSSSSKVGKVAKETSVA